MCACCSLAPPTSPSFARLRAAGTANLSPRAGGAGRRVGLMRGAGGARGMVAGAAASTFLVIGVLLILFPLVTSTVLAVAALATSMGLAGFAIARRRRRRESDVA